MSGDDLKANGIAGANSELDARNIFGGMFGKQSDSPYPVLPTSLEAEEYKMSHRRRGKCIIFNNRTFKSHTRLDERVGTDLDADDLRSCFRDLGFETVMYTDLSCNKTRDVLEKLGKQDYSDDDCFVCCFLTHGDCDVLYGTDGKFLVDTVFEPFCGDACPSLLGKPKLFFIQACRGDRLDAGVQAVLDTSDSPTRISASTHPDILVAYSTVPGFYSWRKPMQGSWFIRALCSVLRQRAQYTDLLSMLTVVCRQVAFDCESYTPKKLHMHRKKQVPFIASTLTRLVYLKRRS